MFGNYHVKQCNFPDTMMLRLHHFLYIFNLRQGTILIAVHQIAISSFMLIILLVGTSHVGEMMSMLHSDMEDDAERRGLYGTITDDEEVMFHEGYVVSTNNQKRFANAKHLALVTVIFLYTSTMLTSIYLMTCISLLYGAIKYKREYMVAWILAACVRHVIIGTVMFLADGYPTVTDLFGGQRYYRMLCVFFVIIYIYAICTVSNFAIETGRGRCRATEERGERLLLLDHAAHSSLLSAAQLNKLSSGTRSQFV